MLIMEGGFFPGMERIYINHEYVRAIAMLDAIPLLIPLVQDISIIEAQISQIDGLLLSGGYDINPLCYDEEPTAELGFVVPELDEHQLTAARIADQLGKPMLGICRGLQIMNVAFGGTLYQDLATTSEPVIQHFQKTQMHAPGHTVNILPSTILENIFGRPSIITNSFHHQAVKDIAAGFIVNAQAKDGFIEGIERINGSFAVAVQWHPEMMIAHHPNMLNIFKRFVEEAKNNSSY
jgi:putative glutamine amidotransferase